MKSTATLAIVLALFASGCRRERAAPPAPPPPTVTVARPVLYPVQSYYEYNGYLDAMQTVEIRARVKGFLKEVQFTEGTEVEEDEPLFLIDDREYDAVVKKASADRLKAAAEVKRTRSEVKRATSLVEKKALSVEELEQRAAAFETAEAVLKQTEALLEGAELEKSFTKIRAPIAGQISRTLVTRGNLVGQNESTLLTTIVSVDRLYVYFDVPERDLVEYQQALKEKAVPGPTSQEVPVEIGVTSEVGYPHAGKIDFRENKVDVGTGTVRIRGQIPNPQVAPGNARLLYPGLYARVRVPSGGPRTLPALPEDAIMTGQEGRYVYVLDKDNVVQKRTVTVGPHVFKGAAPKSGEAWELVKDKVGVAVTSVVAIEKGLAAEDRVVVNGLTRARPGTPVAPEDHEFRSPKK